MPEKFTIKNHTVTLKELRRIKGKLHEGHTADGLDFRCCDFRFRKADDEFMDGLDNGLFDVFSFPGSTMLFLGAKYGHPDMLEGTLYWTKALMKLHHTNKIKFKVHGRNAGRCGAYATTPSLAGKSNDELFRIQVEDTLEVKELIEQNIPEAEVVLIYVDADEESDEFVYSELLAEKAAAIAA